jgi:hypothetical protein
MYGVYVPPVVTMCTMCFNIDDMSFHDVVPRQTLIFSFIHFISFDCKSLPYIISHQPMSLDSSCNRNYNNNLAFLSGVQRGTNILTS